MKIFSLTLNFKLALRHCRAAGFFIQADEQSEKQVHML
jgi:hypothetical protein